jgi:hypothetical protein
MYYQQIQQFNKTLSNLDTILGKAIEQAQARNFVPENLMHARLAPDMFPMWRQVTIACDVAKAAVGSLSGREAPKFEDNEQTLADLRARIAKTQAFLATVQPEDLAQVTPDQKVKVPYPMGKVMNAEDALMSRAVPNFFFHVTTAYALLRTNGVPLSKLDYLGELQYFDA